MRELYERICAGKDLRANLIALKRQINEEGGRERFLTVSGGTCDVFLKCLSDADPKVRKNAADILGLIGAQEALDGLMDAYRAEETLFVRADYVAALSRLDCAAYLGELRRRLWDLRMYDAPETEKKHVAAEIAALQELLLEKEEPEKHRFTGYNRTNEVLLMTLPAFRGLLAADLPFPKMLRPDGVAFSAEDMNLVLRSRYWQEMLFLTGQGRDIRSFLIDNHRGAPPFYFRVGVTGPLPAAERSRLAKRAAAAIEEKYPGDLINSVSHYEAEVRLAADADGRIETYLKLYTIPDRRFLYRRYHVAAGLRPFVAAGLVGLARPYLKENAQVLDPFCGVGTLLIERRLAGPVRSAYGIDTFGEAIEKARKNAQIAGVPVNYIHRDFFDFTHEYLFDEILTDLPGRFGDRAETDAFYGAFLEKSAALLSPKGRIFCYTGETGLLKKHLRLSGRFRLLRQFPILEESGTAFFVLERRD